MSQSPKSLINFLFVDFLRSFVSNQLNVEELLLGRILRGNIQVVKVLGFMRLNFWVSPYGEFHLVFFGGVIFSLIALLHPSDLKFNHLQQSPKE